MKTIIITGANSGIGFETAKHLAGNGNRIIAASREKDSTLTTINELNEWAKKQKTPGEVVFYDLDLSNLKSVEGFANKLQNEQSTLDLLICNAGIMNAPYRLTSDGYESQFEVNYLGHFYLTMLLAERLAQAENPKVISICSSSAEKGKIHNIQELEEISHVSESDFNSLTSYRESKLAMQVTNMQMSRMQEFNPIKFGLIHPGIVNTNLFYRGKSKLYKVLMAPFAYLGYLTGRLQTPKQGAETSIFLAENDDWETGTYWHKKHQIPMNPISKDENYGKEVFEWAKKQIAGS